MGDDEEPTLKDDYRDVIKQFIEEMYGSLDAAHTAIMTAERGHEERGYAALGAQISEKTEFLNQLEDKYEEVEDLTDEIEGEREAEREEAKSQFSSGGGDFPQDIFG